MIARLHSNSTRNTGRRMVVLSTRRRRTTSFASTHLRCILIKQSSIACKRMTRVCAPLALNVDSNNAVSASASVALSRLPRTLRRPALTREVDTFAIEATYPELRGVTPEYVRERLPLAAPQMLAGLSQMQACPPKHALPKELEIILTDAASASCPTHILAIYASSPSPLAPSTSNKRKITLFPVHHLVLAANCSNLSSFPSPVPTTSSSTTFSLPIVPLALPSPAAFPLLQTYLYTKDAAQLLVSLVPAGTKLTTWHAALVHGIWADACALGVVDRGLFDVIDCAWAAVLGGLSGQS